MRCDEKCPALNGGAFFLLTITFRSGTFLSGRSNNFNSGEDMAKKKPEHGTPEQKPMKKSNAIREALDSANLGIDAAANDVIDYCKSKYGLEPSAQEVSVYRTKMKNPDGGTSSGGKSGGSAPTMADFIEGNATLKALAKDMDAETIKSHLAGLRRFLSKFTDGDIEKLLEQL